MRIRPAISLFLLAVSFCHAQLTTTGVITGAVTDPSGLAIVGAKISITNTVCASSRLSLADHRPGTVPRNPIKLGLYRNDADWKNT